jgi:uncharacterized RDD family membrane protein YckC
VNEVAPEHVIDSATGIDVSLPIAGPGARSYAFVIDWHIRLVLALAWYVVGVLLYNGRPSLSPPLTNESRWFALVVAPALAIYFLYHFVVELAMRGSTPGKRTAGVRIVTRDGAAPSAGALLLRNVFRVVDSMPAFYPVGLITVMLTRDHVRLGDMAAGTLLVYERGHAAAPLAERERGGGLDAPGAEILAELLQRWPTLSSEARVRLARQFWQRYFGDTTAMQADADEAWHARLQQLTQSGS